jgi:hypothetical protein
MLAALSSVLFLQAGPKKRRDMSIKKCGKILQQWHSSFLIFQSDYKALGLALIATDSIKVIQQNLYMISNT